MMQGDRVWVKVDGLVWDHGVVESATPDQLSVIVQSSGDILTTKATNTIEAMPADLEGVPDLLALGNLNEASILYTLRFRFQEKKQAEVLSLPPPLLSFLLRTILHHVEQLKLT